MDTSLFVEILFSGSIKDAILTVIRAKIQEGADYVHIKSELNQAIEQYLEIQSPEQREQLETIIEKNKEDLANKIQNRDIQLLINLNNQLDEKFQTCQVPIESRENLKNNLMLFILDMLKDVDINFAHDLELMQNIIEEQCRNNLQDAKIEVLKEQLSKIRKALRDIQSKAKSPIEVVPSQPQIDDPSKIVGHESILENIQAMYDGGSNVAFLYGRPGMGKTTLAKRYARAVCKERDVYFIAYEESIEHTVAKLAKSDLKNGGKVVLDYWKKEEQEKPILLVIDNFDENVLQRAEDRGIEEELTGEHYKELVNTGIHILFTTRTRIEQNAIEVTPVNETLQLFEKYYGSEADGENEKKIIGEIIRILQGNTLLIILVANILKRFDFCQKASEILNRLMNGHMQEETTRIGTYADIQDREAQTVYEQTYALLDMSSIRENSDANTVFANALLLPLDGMNKQEFLTLTESENDNTLMNLIDSSWILMDNGTIYLHPMIREIAVRNNYVSVKLCENYYKNIREKIVIGAQFEERLKYKKYAQEVFKLLNSPDMMNLDLLRLFYDLSDIYDELGERAYSLEIAKVIKDNINLYDGNPMEKVRVMSGVAYSLNNCYDGMETLDKAHELLQQAKQILETMMDSAQTDRRECARIRAKILSNLGSNYLAKSKCDQTKKVFYLNRAMKVHKQALEIRQMEYEHLVTDPMRVADMKAAIATSYTTIATDYFYLQNYEEAIVQHEKALEIREALLNDKGKSISQQRIIGCVIEMYRQQLYVDEKYIAQALGYYPELLKVNYAHQNNSALKNNVRYWEELRRIVINDRRLEGFIGEIKEKHGDFVNWVNSDEKLRKIVEEVESKERETCR